MAGKIKPDTPTDENPEWSDEDFAAARKGAEVFADLGIPVPPVRGRPKSENPKQQVTLRLDADVIEHFKAGGKGWQTRINETLVRTLKRDGKTGKILKTSDKTISRAGSRQKSA